MTYNPENNFVQTFNPVVSVITFFGEILIDLPQ